MKNLIALLFFVPVFIKAQTVHIVAPKETLYSVARQYNIQPKELAAYNNISIQSGLTIGQSIKIPANGKLPNLKARTSPTITPVIKKITNTNESGLQPVYHKVEKKETLYHISKLNKNVTVDDIKKWNKLGSDAVAEGTSLIIGYEKIKSTAAPDSVKVIQAAKEPSVVTSGPAKPAAVSDKTEIYKKPVIAETPIEIKSIGSVKKENSKVTSKNFNGGFFKSLYTEQTTNKNVIEEIGTAAIFKTASGWEDGKYYCLHNTAPAGSVLKITNKATQKSVYAKVLDVIPDMEENTGILLRLSNAAADELGVGENNFEVILNY